jgi:hypothetical protein
MASDRGGLRGAAGCGGVGQVEALGCPSLGITTAASPPARWPADCAGRLAKAWARDAKVARLAGQTYTLWYLVDVV